MFESYQVCLLLRILSEVVLSVFDMAKGKDKLLGKFGKKTAQVIVTKSDAVPNRTLELSLEYFQGFHDKEYGLRDSLLILLR